MSSRSSDTIRVSSVLPKHVLIVGATSGLGREMARIYAFNGCRVGVTGRRAAELASLQEEYPEQIVTECFDVTVPDITNRLEALVEKLGGLDLLIYNSGYGDPSEALDYRIDRQTTDINVNGFLAAIHFGWAWFIRQGHGHLAATSSIASIRGNRQAPAYSASKAFESIYLEGLHIKARHLKIPLFITDIEPGFVDTKMAKGPTFWKAPVTKAARQMVQAIQRRRFRVYITRRWRIIAFLFRWIPDFIYHRIG